MPYTIQQGDTLSGIAATNNTDVNSILKLNPNITNPNLIYAGSTLNLPQVQPTQPVVTPQSPTQTPQPTTQPTVQPNVQPSVQPTAQPQATPSLMEGGSYVVQPGDTLSAIAKKMGVPITSITGYRSGNPNLIYSGEKLSIAGTKPAPVQVTQDQSTSTDANNTPKSALDTPVQELQKTVQTPPPDFIKTYTDTLEKLGVASIKTQFEKVQKQFGDIQNELNDKISGVNDNPWLTEGVRVNQINKLKEKYQGKLDILTNQMKLYDSLYQEGVAQAKFLTTGEVEQQQNAQELAQKGLESAQAIMKEVAANKYKNIKEVNGGLYDLDSDMWIIPPKAENGTYQPPNSYKEWELAGGQKGTGKTYSEWVSATNVKPATVAQQTIATYATRIEQANPTLQNLEHYIVNLNPLSFEAQIRLPSYLQSSEFQQYMQAARNFVNAVLRRESGAVISPSEFENAYNQYLPRPGDSLATLAQKRTSRDIVYQSFKSGAGTAYQSVDELLGANNSTNDPLGIR